MANKMVETKTRIINARYLTEEMKELFAEENGCYLSSNKKQILFTDTEFFDLMNKKFGFSRNERNGKRIQPYTIRHWVRNLYKVTNVHYFNIHINLASYAESTEEMADIWYEDGVICVNGWDEVLKDYIKLSVVIELLEKLDYQSLYEMDREEIDYVLQKMRDKGYDTGILKEGIDKILAEQES